MGVSSYDPDHPDLGWQPSIPEPLWVRTPIWRQLLLREPAWRASCCGTEYDDEYAYGRHWLAVHSTPQEG